jgi:hypothetical protein
VTLFLDLSSSLIVIIEKEQIIIIMNGTIVDLKRSIQPIIDTAIWLLGSHEAAAIVVLFSAVAIGSYI